MMQTNNRTQTNHRLPRRLSRTLLSALAGIALGLLAVTLFSGLSPVSVVAESGSSPDHVRDETLNQVALVVVLADGAVKTQCVEFAEEQISSTEALSRSNFEMVAATTSFGTAICAIDGTGCTDSNNCFCDAEHYWGFWQQSAGEWVYAQTGSDDAMLSNGAVDGWVWTPLADDPASSPPAVDFDAICGDGALAANQVDVVVQFDQNATVVRSVEFSAPISGLGALLASGLEVEYAVSDFGATVCAIEGVGCPEEDCFCRCAGGDECTLWSYQYWDGANWQSYEIGVGGTVISTTGAIEGYRWGEFGAAMTPVTQTLAAQHALDFVAAAQDPATGGYGGLGSSVEALITIGANLEQSMDWRQSMDAPSLLSFLMLYGAQYTDVGAIAPAAVGKMATGAAGADACWPVGAPVPADFYDETINAYSGHVGINLWAMLGAAAFGDTIPAPAIAGVKESILPVGGWEWMDGFGADTNTTSLAIQALVAAGEPISATEIISGLIFLKGAQNDDGGFAYDPASTSSTASDANSTGYVLQALVAAGEDSQGPNWVAESGKSGIDYLMAAQLEDGSLEWQTGAGRDLLATQQAVPALLGRHYPFVQGSFTQPIERCDALYVPLLSAD